MAKKVTHIEVINNTLNAACKEYKEYKAIKAEAEARIEELETLIKEFMVAEGIDEFVTNDTKVTYKECTKTNINKDIVRELVGNEYDKINAFDRLTVTG